MILKANWDFQKADGKCTSLITVAVWVQHGFTRRADRLLSCLRELLLLGRRGSRNSDVFCSKILCHCVSDLSVTMTKSQGILFKEQRVYFGLLL